MASAFRPAGDGHEIGGDFFDVFPMGPECWMMVIGDVCGKGAEAAALTALARYTLRAAAIQEGAEPAELLVQLNEAVMLQRDDTRFLTAVCAFLESGGSDGGLRITLSVAGHPSPLKVSAAGVATKVGGLGALIGVWDAPDLREEVIHLRQGERLVLYTDGVVEAGAPSAELGDEGLAQLLADTAGQSAAATVAAIEEAVLSREKAAPRDDLAVLVVRPDPERDR
jgi:serine phosphatase RsbU (regulator of sigma subunit)